MQKIVLWGFLAVFALMLVAGLAINLYSDTTVYLAPLFGLVGTVWALLRLCGITHLAGLRIGRNDGDDRDA